MQYVSREQLRERIVEMRGKLLAYVSQPLQSQHQSMVQLGHRDNYKILMDQIDDLDQQFKAIELALIGELEQPPQKTTAPIVASTRA